MSTIEDFENAPVGATATRKVPGSRALKVYESEWIWVTQNRVYLDNEKIAKLGYTLEPSTPTTAREALELAWELAHPVKEGQIVPEGARYLTSSGSGLKESTSCVDQKMSPHLASINRTLDPLPDPDPEWLKAPAVIAHTDNDDTRRVWTAHRDERWASTSHTYTRLWQNLHDVVPLYPEGEKA